MLRLDPCVGYLLAGVFALFFAWAAYLKSRDLKAFTAVVDRYQLLPGGMAPAAAYLAPVGEAAIAMLLFVPQLRSPAAFAGAALCLLYAAAIGINLERGRRDLDCGCSGPSKRRPISGWMVWRNLVLAALLLVICLPWSPRPLDGTDAVTIVGGVLGLTLLYAAADSLIAITQAGRAMRGMA